MSKTSSSRPASTTRDTEICVGTAERVDRADPKSIVTSTGERDTPHLYTAPPPVRDAHGVFVFADAPALRPNLSPEEVLRRGSFGGTYFRNIASGVTGKVHVDAWRELPPAWIAGLDVPRMVASPFYDTGVNTYGVKAGTDLRAWEGSGWIVKQDPFGWFQWVRAGGGNLGLTHFLAVTRWAAGKQTKTRARVRLQSPFSSSLPHHPPPRSTPAFSRAAGPLTTCGRSSGGRRARVKRGGGRPT